MPPPGPIAMRAAEEHVLSAYKHATNACHGHSRQGEGLTQMPSSLQAVAESLRVYADATSPIGYTKRLVAIRNKICNARIFGLILKCRPSAVARLVVSVIVLSVDTHPNWSRPHVGKKTLKRVPTLADGDAAPAVIGKLRSARIATTYFHRHPRRVLGAVLPSELTAHRSHVRTRRRKSALDGPSGSRQAVPQRLHANTKPLRPFVNRQCRAVICKSECSTWRSSHSNILSSATHHGKTVSAT